MKDKYKWSSKILEMLLCKKEIMVSDESDLVLHSLNLPKDT